MVLDVETPGSPDLTNRGTPSELDASEVIEGESDLRRGELEGFFRDGAWSEAFNEWAEYTDLSESEYELVREEGLIEQMDFYWDPVTESLQFEVPVVPEGDVASKIRTELTDLGQTVVEMLEDGYVDWNEKNHSEMVWSEEKSSEEPTMSDRD
ncbi:hypothetical protein [Haloferax profundi]|uniref:DUF7992 domain-containing protein n=1 Tax=Haloferax profundi TaxID=1544718 RepID=A0A0W1RJL7_9EURY|nr:hypothetical protein [Haloferax profundi]KTG13644.1 hypothetical protein AUR66_19320 [Haloferax profundi]